MRPLRSGSNRSNGRDAGHEEQRRIVLPPLGVEMHGQRRVVELPGDAAIEIGIVGGRDRRFRLRPQRRAVGNLGGLGAGLLDDRDRHRHMAGVLLDQALDGEALGEGFRVLHQMQDDAGAAAWRRNPFVPRLGVDGRHRIGALAVGRPLPRLRAAGAARDHVDAVGDRERRVEADAELADQRRAFRALRRLDAIEKRLGAGAGDGAERLDHLLARHADAVVLDGELALLGVDRKRDARRGVLAEQRGIGDRLVAQPLAGVGGVGDQLAQEHGAVGIDRMHHQVQKLGDVRLERAVFGAGLFGCGRHGAVPRALHIPRPRWNSPRHNSRPHRRHIDPPRYARDSTSGVRTCSGRKPMPMRRAGRRRRTGKASNSFITAGGRGRAWAASTALTARF